MVTVSAFVTSNSDSSIKLFVVGRVYSITIVVDEPLGDVYTPADEFLRASEASVPVISLVSMMPDGVLASKVRLKPVQTNAVMNEKGYNYQNNKTNNLANL